MVRTFLAWSISSLSFAFFARKLLNCVVFYRQTNKLHQLNHYLEKWPNKWTPESFAVKFYLIKLSLSSSFLNPNYSSHSLYINCHLFYHLHCMFIIQSDLPLTINPLFSEHLRYFTSSTANYLIETIFHHPGLLPQLHLDMVLHICSSNSVPRTILKLQTSQSKTVHIY